MINIHNLETERGFFMAKELIDQYGMNYTTIHRMVKDGRLERLAPGCYCREEDLPDYYALIQCLCPNAIFSFNSALWLNGMNDYLPQFYEFTLPRGSHAPTVYADINMKVNYVLPNLFSVGLTQIETINGCKVNVYDKERCLCDIWRRPELVSEEDAGRAIRSYFRGSDFNSSKLHEYAQQFDVEEKVGDAAMLLVM